MSDEAFEVFDDSGNPQGVAPRSRVHREGLWHRAASVFLFRTDGRLIIQRRQWTKYVCPGTWDLSVAEHLKPSETYVQGAMRGLSEELEVEEVALEPLGGISRAQLNIPDIGVKDYELQQAFRGVYDGPLRPDASEVLELDAWLLPDLYAAFARRPKDFTPWFRDSTARLGLC
jgi:isopentenyl-diphosphate delta-isomerase